MVSQKKNENDALVRFTIRVNPYVKKKFSEKTYQKSTSMNKVLNKFIREYIKE